MENILIREFILNRTYFSIICKKYSLEKEEYEIMLKKDLNNSFQSSQDLSFDNQMKGLDHYFSN